MFVFSPNSPIFCIIACCNLSIVFSSRASLCSMFAILSLVVLWNMAMSPVFFLNSLNSAVTTCSAISVIVSVSVYPPPPP